MKTPFITIALVLSIFCTLLTSCADSCDGVTCDYDGTCESGDCICSDVTTNYLLGDWELEGTGEFLGTFGQDTYTDKFGNVVSYELNSQAKIISLESGNKLVIQDDGFSCNQMMIKVESSLSPSVDLVFVRR